MDEVLLILGFFRVLIWLGGAALALYHRRSFLGAGLLLAGLNSITFAFANAGAKVPMTLFDVSAYLATPISTLIIVGVAFELQRTGRNFKWGP